MTKSASKPSAIGNTRQVDIDRGSGFAASLDRDRQHREKAKSIRPLRRLLPFIFAYPGTVLGFILALLVAAGLTLLLPQVGRLVIDCGFGDIAAANPQCTRLPILSGLSSYFILGFAVAVAFGFVSALRFFLISRLAERVVADLRKAVYDHLLSLSLTFYSKVRTGEVLSRLTTDTTLIQTVVGYSISFALRTVVTMVGAVVMMFVTNWQLCLMVLIIGPLIMMPLILFGRRLQRLSRDSQDRLADASARASEVLRAIGTVQAFTREPSQRQDFGDAVEVTYRAGLARIVTRSLMTFALFSFVLSALIAVLWFGASQVANGNITPGEMAQFVFYAIMAVSGGSVLSEAFADIMRAAGASERLMELLSEKPDIAAPARAYQLLEPVKGQIDLKNVSFSYPGHREQLTLNSVNFSVQPGQTVALVGPSGAGKSTVFQLLLRLYDPVEGQICLDGVNVKDLSPTALRGAIAIVSQNAPLFAGTVAENIRFGQEAATDAQILEAAKAANAHDFIMSLPNKYETVLAEGAGNLSGGQRQRIAIARAIVRDAPLLLLDEATSALDSESETAIQTAFETISASRTTIIIAHRLATVRRSDNIIVLDQGRVVDQGTHDQLLANRGLYARLVELQFGDAEP